MPMVPLLDYSLLPNLAVTTLLNLLQIFLFKILVNIYRNLLTEIWGRTYFCMNFINGSHSMHYSVVVLLNLTVCFGDLSYFLCMFSVVLCSSLLVILYPFWNKQSSSKEEVKELMIWYSSYYPT